LDRLCCVTKLGFASAELLHQSFIGYIFSSHLKNIRKDHILRFSRLLNLPFQNHQILENGCSIFPLNLDDLVEFFHVLLVLLGLEFFAPLLKQSLSIEEGTPIELFRLYILHVEQLPNIVSVQHELKFARLNSSLSKHVQVVYDLEAHILTVLLWSTKLELSLEILFLLQRYIILRSLRYITIEVTDL
jgi:hypothetical protein